MPGDSVIAGSKLKHNAEKSQSNLHELRLVQKSVPKSEWPNIKLTMITPAWFHFRYKQGRAYTKEAYANDADYFKDVAKVYQAELEQLYQAGLRNVQFDDPGLACRCPLELGSLIWPSTQADKGPKTSAPTSCARDGPRTRTI